MKELLLVIAFGTLGACVSTASCNKACDARIDDFRTACFDGLRGVSDSCDAELRTEQAKTKANLAACKKEK